MKKTQIIYSRLRLNKTMTIISINIIKIQHKKKIIIYFNKTNQVINIQIQGKLIMIYLLY